MEYEARIGKIRDFLEKQKLNAIITKNSSHIFYLTGLLEIEGYLIIDNLNLHLFVSPLNFYESLDSFRYNKKIKNLYIKKLNNKTLQKFLSRYKKTGFIKTEISYQTYKNFQKEVKTKLIPVDDFLLDIRMIKTEGEKKMIEKAKEITEKTFKKIEGIIKEEVNELDIVAEIKYQLIKNGARKESFEPIVASGVFSSYPHHKSKNKKIK
ncbi:MAG: M24 family metallopeptidase, partial [Candidatus Ratteibacteria bacterium]